MEELQQPDYQDWGHVIEAAVTDTKLHRLWTQFYLQFHQEFELHFL